MAIKSNFDCRYDGISLNVTLTAKPLLMTKLILLLFNLFILAFITFFAFMRFGMPDEHKQLGFPSLVSDQSIASLLGPDDFIGEMNDDD
ncbi:hypothetical protein ACVWYN_003005 [Pedobacter sp. UYP24]